MISSMTGFAARTLHLGDASLAIEMKSVNQRFLEIAFRLPEELRSLESAIRDAIGKRIHRGKVECRMVLTTLPARSGHIGLNGQILESLVAWQADIRRHFPDAAALTTGEILRWPGVVDAGQRVDTLAAEALSGVGQVLDDLVASRQREGERLAHHILSLLEQAEQRVARLRAELPTLARQLREKLARRIADALGDDSHERLAQEVALFAQKMDIEEELARLATHFAEVRRVLAAGGVVGKRLDFLMQELHREANTLGAKSLTTETTNASLDLKVLIEQMREQVQNLE
jgi:uncharacterized protein (TIGR00255 family)